MNETKTKISLLWYGFCFLWFVALLPAIFTVSRPAAVKLVSTQPQVLGAYTTNARGENDRVTSTVPSLKGEIDASAVNAKSFLVYDQETGKVLLSKNSAVKVPVASLTKLLTALVAYEELDLNAYFTVPQNVGVKDDPSLGIQAGEEVRGIDLFNAMLIGSENDAAQILRLLTEQKTGASFVELMNKRASELGMASSMFSNALGFDSSRNYSTAEDLQKLINETQKRSVFMLVGKQNSYPFLSKSGKEYRATATNKLIKTHPDIYAIKTGNTREALGCMATRITVQGRSMVIIVLGSWDREGDTLRLKDLVEKSVEWGYSD